MLLNFAKNEDYIDTISSMVTPRIMDDTMRKENGDKNAGNALQDGMGADRMSRKERLEIKKQRVARLRAHGEQMQQEVQWAMNHFTSHFSAVLANTTETLNAAYRIRHEVFCEEIKIFEGNDTRLESDSYDTYASQCMIQHNRSSDYAGAVRIILPQNENQILPIEKQGLDYIDRKDLLPENFNRNEIAEISRILIPKVFRKRKIDKAACAANTGINIELYDENDMRCFPFIAVGLYMACAAICAKDGRKHAYFMADPRLGKSMQVVGLPMTQIGSEFEYVGRRVPYYINWEEFINKLKPSFLCLLEEFRSNIV